jgi:linoleoyl-CoA desaturase
MVKFSRTTGFQRELKKAVDEYFTATGLRRRDVPAMYLKSAVILCWCALSYWLLVFVVTDWYQAVPLCLSLAVGLAGVGFNIQHDANHEAYSNSRFINLLMGSTLDLVGGSSYMWRIKHNVIHHTYTNIVGVDTDIDLGSLAHLPPGPKPKSIHRFQFLYLWFFYGLLAIKWQWFDDFRDLFRRRMGVCQVALPNWWESLRLFSGKAVFFCLMFVIPATQHSLGTVLLFYFFTSFVLGLMLSVVFQLAHCVEEANFRHADNKMTDWAIHQVETTANFARRSRLLTWYVGSLNYQIEHHLFPKICHLHYPALSPLVEQICAKFGVQYSSQETLSGAIGSHYRFLRSKALS